ncbi:MAG: hypothetical protein SWH68_08680 [Thermodesulfobacteriota bacterium]|nr:hypothetical protein [Thermodesulfobacteriota bacterium]
MAEVKLLKERNKSGEIVSVTVSIDRDGATERRRFGSEEEAQSFIRRLKESEAEKKEE